jgi:ATP-binding cassette subfamily B protein
LSEQNAIIHPLDPARMPVRSESLVRWVGFFLYPYWKIFAGFLIFRIARYTVIAMVPFMIGYKIKAFETGMAHDDPQRLFTVLAAYMTLYGVALMSIFLFVAEARAEDRMVRGMTLFSVRHMNALPLAWHEAQGSGGKLQRAMTARASMKQMYNIYKWTAVPFTAGLLSIVLSVAMLDAPWFFLLLYAGFIATFIATGLFMARKIPKLHDRHNAVLEKLMSGVYEFVSAVRTVKAFHMGDYIEREARRLEGDGLRAMTDIFRATYGKWSALNIVGFFWIGIFIVTCTLGVYQGWLSTGAFATIFFMAHALWGRLEEVVYMQDEFLQARSGFMRLTETLKSPPVSYDVEPLLPYDAGWSGLCFDRVDFEYGTGDGGAPPALHEVSIRIGRGEKIALVGRSGAGKSTLVKLLMKQTAPSKGTIYLDSTNLAQVPTQDWLAHIGYVPQDVELFNTDIRSNILLDLPYDGNEDRYRRALKHAALNQLIESLPEGDKTLVGERGIKLSGGQRQRLGIARALVRDAEIIIFDEATASLDSLSEGVIQDALRHAFKDRTMIIIAHRLSTVKFADRIVVMENGRVIEEGTFNELIARNGAFARLWAMQSSGFVDEEDGREHANG